ncbi:hypothetical protein HQ305_14470 [Rhodococcus sp. BP-149]|uniref:hypothetical protein n=1 Tax=unclassified Rhodococcus (in: high G+C Gram-positive bacteria) TaxID=192944 RepID=UPI001C9BB809|nr:MULTISPECIES: hypothetical protein [unclassified Rhodococcus (in: high G+C Gram-positive bacteria)]MBY6686764.1 hypothetical protein [Rhodococcus sp. BP-288]MBY6695626.1 hypothetical protein [Rhodococcus sp. BP-188]MBY6700256.1 hypothetical protein [Rhodococcus sp. BP-285]MBY6704721.1 hypothetical protein [Rhodococcus sp. BP-283]MBY6713381.1 hypothetical protein [Rhodococcus sp. BP-160]
MSRRITRALVGATAAGAGAVAIALSGSATASAAPAQGPIYWQSFGVLVIPASENCQNTAARYRERGDIILVDCAVNLAYPGYQLVGIRTDLFGS